jgi:hypothetical protein
VGDSVAYSARVLVARVNVTTGVAHAVGPGEAMIGASWRERSAFVALAVLATPDRR